MTSRSSGADIVAARLAARGVRHVFGVGGANIEDMFLAIQRRRPGMMAILNKHEHSAGAAADAYSRVSRSLGVVMTTSGGGAMNLMSALAESMASRVPVLAIVGEPPTSLQGRGAFQDTSGRGGSVDAQTVFRGVSVWCERAASARELPGLIDAAARTAWEQCAPAVLLVAKDLQQALVATEASFAEPPSISLVDPTPDRTAIREACQVLLTPPIVLIVGDEVARAGVRKEIERLALLIDARVVAAPDARDAFDNSDPRFAGVIGAMGHESAVQAVANAAACLLVGTRLPLLARQGYEAVLATKPIVSIARDSPFVTSPNLVHIAGDLTSSLRALAEELEAKLNEPTLLPPLHDRPPAAAGSFGSEAILAAVERTMPENGVVLVDAGNTGAHAVHHLRAPKNGRWLVAMGMAGMGYTFGASIGAALASGQRAVVLAGDGAFFMHGLEIHTAIQHQLPITYVIFNNRAHGMCLVRERLLLGEESGYNRFCESRIGAGLAAMFPGLHASDCRTREELEGALANAATQQGPSVVCAELDTVEVPPFAALQAALMERNAAQEKAIRA